ncbi:Uncharacterized protein Rs2_39620 [Raphanus sativus]|nr:Uncharacterized protein Rs2_39620 [Raphanus sativus]
MRVSGRFSASASYGISVLNGGSGWIPVSYCNLGGDLDVSRSYSGEGSDGLEDYDFPGFWKSSRNWLRCSSYFQRVQVKIMSVVAVSGGVSGGQVSDARIRIVRPA